MSFDPQRRTSVEPSGLQIPNAAVQEQRYAEVARTVFEKLRYGARKSNSHRPKEDDATGNNVYARAKSQSTRFESGCRIRALDINETRTHVILAGGQILKSLKVEGGASPKCQEEFDLRTAPVRYDLDSRPQGRSSPRGGRSQHKSKAASAHRDDIEDVAWSNGVYSRYIATAAANGKIMLYDVENASVGIACLHEHYRQVHKVDFNPMEGAFLLSGSQDGTVRLWDLRNPTRDVMLGASKQTFPGRSDGVRHVKWSPRNTWSFAFGTDSGTIQRWDTRNSSGPVVKISGHAQTCNSVDWHPDGKHLVSAGKDQTVKVWNLSPENRRHRPVCSFRTPREVQNVRWRASNVFLDSHGHFTKQCTQLATSYRRYPVVHVWDLRRPQLPFKEVHHEINSGTTDMLWQSTDLLWTVGPEGAFTQTDVAFAPVSLERRPISTFACGPNDEISMCLEERPTFRFDPLTADAYFQSRQPDGYEQQAFRKGLGDEGFDENFIFPRAPRRRHSRTPSIKSIKSTGAALSSADDVAKLTTVDLDETIGANKNFSLRQFSSQGSAPGSTSSSIFSFLAQKYKLNEAQSWPSLEFFQNCEELFELNAGYVQRASYYRDAQTWRILGRTIKLEIEKRANNNRARRLSRSGKPERHTVRTSGFSKPSIATSDLTKRAGDQIHEGALQATFEKRKTIESSSNVATPLAKPVEDVSDSIAPEPLSGSPPLDGIAPLPPAVVVGNVPRSAIKGSASINSPRAPPSSSKWTDHVSEIDEKRAAMNQWKAPPKTPLSLDTPLQRSSNIDVPARVDRQNSTDSFMMFSTSSGSQLRDSLTNSFVSGVSSQSIEQQSDDYPMDHSGESSSAHDSSSVRTGPILLEDSYRKSAPIEAVANSQNTKAFSSTTTSEEDPSDQTQLKKAVSIEENDYSWPNPLEYEYLLKAPKNSKAKAAVAKIDSNVTQVKDEKSVEPLELQVINRKTSGRDRLSLLPDQRTKSAPGAIQAETPEAEHFESLSQDFLVSDFLDTPATETSPAVVSAVNMLNELLKWYTTRGNAQMAAALFLVSLPLLNLGTHSKDQDSKTPNAPWKAPYIEYLASTGSFSPEEADRIVAKTHQPLLTAGLPPLWMESILSTYHEQLVALQLLSPAAELRRLSYPAFPSVYEQSIKDVHTGLVCLACKKPINNPTNAMRCESCDSRQAECAICLSNETPFELSGQAAKRTNDERKKRKKQRAASASSLKVPQPDVSPPHDAETTPPPSSSLWTTCPHCNHSTHTACAQAWHASPSSGGACPVPACLCDCTPGTYRGRRIAALEQAERTRRKGGAAATSPSPAASPTTPAAAAAVAASAPDQQTGSPVRRDDWSVGESRAVGVVRGALRGSGSWSSDTERGDDLGKRVRVLVPSSSSSGGGGGIGEGRRGSGF